MVSSADGWRSLGRVKSVSGSENVVLDEVLSVACFVPMLLVGRYLLDLVLQAFWYVGAGFDFFGLWNALTMNRVRLESCEWYE